MRTTLDEVNRLSQVDVHQFYGIEVEEWPVRIAEVALWLMDHQSNLQILAAFSQPFLRLPLRNSPHIHYGNALLMDWNTLLPASECSFILGNPPFIGAMFMTESQRQEIVRVSGETSGVGVLDYVSGWYFKAAEYIQGTDVAVAFVSTNSITQGEQVGILWTLLFQYSIHIRFAYRTFVLQSEARGKAHVHVVIVCFSMSDAGTKTIFEEDKDGKITPTVVRNISPYLIEGTDNALRNRSVPLCQVPGMVWGSQPRRRWALDSE